MPRHSFTLEPATPDDAPALALLHTAVADHLTRHFGQGPWSTHTSAKGVLLALRTTQVFLARQSDQIIATLHLTKKKPWAIDTKYFTQSPSPLYLLAMAVTPERQRQGIGQQCLLHAQKIARNQSATALRLDAYDAPAGAGPFYARSGFTPLARASYRNTPLQYYELLLP